MLLLTDVEEAVLGGLLDQVLGLALFEPNDNPGLVHLSAVHRRIAAGEMHRAAVARDKARMERSGFEGPPFPSGAA